MSRAAIQSVSTTGDQPLLTGLLAFPLTAFNAGLDLDLDGCSQVIERHIDAGAAALFVGCGTGEFSALRSDEQIALWRRAVQTVAGRVPVWVGVGGGPAAARAGMRAAASIPGVDGALLLPPYLVSGPSSGLVDHVRYAVQGSSLPTVVYHRSTAVFDAAATISLLDIDEVVGLKDGYGSVDAMVRIVNSVRTSGHRRASDFLFFNGLPTAEVTVAAYAAIDVARYSSAVHCFAPEIAHTFHDALHRGDAVTMQRLLADFYIPLVELRDETPGFAVSLVKAAARMRGDRVGHVRPPLATPTDEQLGRLSDIIACGQRAITGLRAS